MSGPKRPHDRVSVSDFKDDFKKCLMNKVHSFAMLCGVLNFNFMQVGFKGYQIHPSRQADRSAFQYEGKEYGISHG